MTELTQSVVGSPLCLIFFLCYLQQALGSGGPGGLTVWTGSAFDCLSSEIVLLHPHFSSAYGSFGVCNNGAIVAQSISVEGNNYTSQLNITFTSDIAGKTILCLYDNGWSTTLHLSQVIPTIGPFSPPNEFYISNANFVSRALTFTWSPVAPDCPAIHYNILASNCGSCPTTTNHTTVTCTDVPTDGRMCTSAVQTLVCGNITGNFSNSVNVTTSVLDHTANYIASISALASALIICVLVSITAILIILIKSKAKLKAALELKQTSRAERKTHLESQYEDVTGPLPSTSAISTQDNVAYGHTQTSTATI